MKTAISVYNSPRLVNAPLRTAIIWCRRGICSNRMHRSLPLQIKYPPISFASSFAWTNCWGDRLCRWHRFDRTIIGMSPTIRWRRSTLLDPLNARANVRTNGAVYEIPRCRHSAGSSFCYLYQSLSRWDSVLGSKSVCTSPLMELLLKGRPTWASSTQMESILCPGSWMEIRAISAIARCKPSLRR